MLPVGGCSHSRRKDSDLQTGNKTLVLGRLRRAMTFAWRSRGVRVGEVGVSQGNCIKRTVVLHPQGLCS